METQLAPQGEHPAPAFVDLAQRLQGFRDAARASGVQVLEAEWMGGPGVRLKPMPAADLARMARDAGDGILYTYPRPLPLGMDAQDVIDFTARAMEAAASMEGADSGAIAVFPRLRDAVQSVGSPSVSVGFLRQGIYHHCTVEDEDACRLLASIEERFGDADPDDLDDEDDEEQLWEMDREDAAAAILDEIERQGIPDEVRREKPRIVAQDAARSLTGPERLTGMPRERVHQAVLLAASWLRRT